jgi:TldD protein
MKMIHMNKLATATVVLALLIGAPLYAKRALAAVPDPLASEEVRRDPVLRAMAEELARSRDELKLEKMQRPYYLEYSISEMEQYTAEAEFGGLRIDQRSRTRLVRVVVRLGDHKQDSYFRTGEGSSALLPVDDDVEALRHHLWLATDDAYKRAAAALTQKQAALQQIETEQGINDFSDEKPAESLAATLRLTINVQPWRELVRSVSGMYRSDPQIQSWGANAIFAVQTRYFVNSEGTVLRSSRPQYSFSFGGTAQAADGEHVDFGRSYAMADERELPSPEKIRADAEKVLATLKELRQAPLVDEEYRGPVLFAPDASTSLVNSLLANNVLGRKPQFGSFARTSGEFASSYKSRVLPDFLTVVDDPTTTKTQGRSLLGSYDFDDEGVAARPVTVVDKGVLVNYLIGRQPIRDFPASNGHGRSAPAAGAAPHIGNLFVRASQTQTPEELKARLIAMCKDQGRPYCYFVPAISGPRSPRLLYRVYVKDGHTELVRGASFDQLDARAMRGDIIAAGNDPEVSNRADSIPSSVVAPSLLFDELVIRRSNQSKEKLPLYPPPDAPAGSMGD